MGFFFWFVLLCSIRGNYNITIVFSDKKKKNVVIYDRFSSSDSNSQFCVASQSYCKQLLLQTHSLHVD